MEGRGGGIGSGWAGRLTVGLHPRPLSPRRRAREHLRGREARRRAAAAGRRGDAALRAQRLQAGGAQAGAGERRVSAGSGAGRGASTGSETASLPLQASEELLREHYAELRERPFYGRLVKYMGSGPVVAMVSGWDGSGPSWPRCHVSGVAEARADLPLPRCGRGWTSFGPPGHSSGPRTLRTHRRAPSGGTSALRSASKRPRPIRERGRTPSPGAARSHQTLPGTGM